MRIQEELKNLKNLRLATNSQQLSYSKKIAIKIKTSIMETVI